MDVNTCISVLFVYTMHMVKMSAHANHACPHSYNNNKTSY